MNLRIEGAFVYFTIPVFGGIPITQTTVSHLIVTVFLCTASILLGRNLEKRPGKLQVLVEKGVILLQNQITAAMGPGNLRWLPLVGTIFLSSLFGSFIGLTGFFRSSTADLSCTLVWAVLVSVVCWYNEIRHRGFRGWLKGFAEPVAVMTPMNIISAIAQPLSMAFRHFGNLAGGGVVTGLIYAALSLASSRVIRILTAGGWLPGLFLTGLGGVLIFRWRRSGSKLSLLSGLFCAGAGISGLLHTSGILPDIPFLTYGIPGVLSCYFDLFSGFVQAYVFTLLTMVYIAGSLPDAAVPPNPAQN